MAAVWGRCRKGDRCCPKCMDWRVDLRQLRGFCRVNDLEAGVAVPVLSCGLPGRYDGGVGSKSTLDGVLKGGSDGFNVGREKVRSKIQDFGVKFVMT